MIILVNETLLLLMVSLLIVAADQDCYKNDAGEEICKIASDTYDPEVCVQCICSGFCVNIVNHLGIIE